MMRNLAYLVFVVMLGGCATTFAPRSEAEKASGYAYVSIDPFAVLTIKGDDCSGNAKYRGLLESLPDNAVRMLVERITASGKVTYGPAKLGARGESYRVTIDYINADTVNFR